MKTFYHPPWRKLFEAKYMLLWVLLFMLLFFSLISSSFRTPGNLLEILRGSGILAVLILGLTWIVAAGEFDVSFPQIAALAAVLTALLVKHNVPIAWAILIALGCGVFAGALNGYLIGYLKLQALITTIAVGIAAQALAYLFGDGGPIYLQVPGLVYGLVYGKILQIPVLFLATLLIYLVCCIIQDRTITGQHIYALGENRLAAKEAGLNESKIIFFSFLLGGILSAIGGILLTAQMSAGMPQIGFNYFYDGVTAVFVGALIFKAGKPNLIGTLIAVIMLQVLSSGLTHLGIEFYIATIIKGLLLVCGVLVVTLSRHKHMRSNRLIID